MPVVHHPEEIRMTTNEPSAAPPPPPQAAAVAQFPITTTLEFPEWPIERSLGMVFGVVVRSMGVAKGFAAGFKSMAGGEVKQYTRLVEDSRRHAMDRMIENAGVLGANAIVSMRFDSSEVGQGLTEIVAYGTAVVIGSGR
jgi:uncharacterized protein YbjQ (UPF0145 family)